MDGRTIGLLLGGVGTIAGLSFLAKRSESLVEGGRANPKRFMMKLTQIAKDLDREIRPIFEENRDALTAHVPRVVERFDDGEITGCEAIRESALRLYTEGGEDMMRLADFIVDKSDQVTGPLVRKYEKEFSAHAPEAIASYEKSSIGGCEALSSLMRSLDDLYEQGRECPFCSRIKRFCVCG